jgi:hypothetical protein
MTLNVQCLDYNGYEGLLHMRVMLWFSYGGAISFEEHTDLASSLRKRERKVKRGRGGSETALKPSAVVAAYSQACWGC